MAISSPIGRRQTVAALLTLTFVTGLAADSTLAGGTGSKPPRRLGSVAVMLAGAAAGAGLLQLSPTAVIAIAAILVGAVSAAFMTATRVPARRAPSPATGPAPSLSQAPARVPAPAGRT